MMRIIWRAAGLAAYAGLLVAIVGFTSYFSFSRFVSRGALAAPDLIGVPLDVATERVEAMGLRVRHLEREDRFAETMPAGLVLQQDPVPGSLVKQGGKVEVVLSRGRQLVTVPDLSGDAIQAAQTELAAAGLLLGRRERVFWPGSEVGTVVQQSPAAGASIDQSSAVDLLLSLEDPTRTFVMPDLVYRQVAEVRRFFDRRGFRFGSVKYEPYEGVEGGVVLRHTPLAGHPLRQHDVITLVVATDSES
jgi:serine/threonine-protein kinase